MIFENVKKLCEKNEISIYKLEKELEFSPGCISKWKKSSPSVDKLLMVAEYFGVSLEYFISGKERKAV